MLEPIGRRWRAQAVHAEAPQVDPGLCRINEHAFIDAIGGQSRAGLARDWLEQRRVGCRTVTGGIAVSVDSFGTAQMQRQIAQFVVLAAHTQVQHDTA